MQRAKRYRAIFGSQRKLDVNDLINKRWKFVTIITDAQPMWINQHLMNGNFFVSKSYMNKKNALSTNNIVHWYIAYDHLYLHAGLKLLNGTDYNAIL